MARRRGERPLSLIFAAVLLCLGGCNSNEAIDKHIERARTARETGHLPTAIIELRNALQQDSRNVTARLLLAQTSIDMSDGAGGEAQVLRAKQDGAKDVDTARPLAEAELLEGKYTDVLKTTAEMPEDSTYALKASLLALRGAAFVELAQMDNAQAAFDAALKQDSHSPDLLIALTRFALHTKDLAAAQKRLGEAQVLAPDDLRIVSLQGDVAYAAHDYANAEQAYQKRLTAQPWNPVARTDLARSQIANDHVPQAIANLDNVLVRVPNNPNVNYLRSLASFRAGDYAAAQTFSLAALSVVADFPRAELIAGASSFALNQFEQANKYLGPYVHAVPDDLVARKLLASVQVALGHPGEAVATLKPALDKTSDDGQLVAMIGMAAARNGDMTTANQYLKQATEQHPEDATLRSEFATTQVALGQTDAGIQDFETAIKAHPQDLRPQLELYLTYMGQKDFDKALQTAQRLQQNLPNDPAGFDMIAVAQLAMGNVQEGRAALLKARELRPGDFNANRNLARLAIAGGKIDEARQYYQDILAANPAHTPTYVEIANLEDGLGHLQAAEAALHRAVQMNPADPMAHAALAKFELSKGRFQQALDAVRPALDKFPRSPILLEEAGRARLALGQSGDALATFKTLAEVLPNTGWVHLMLAEAFTEEGITNSAITEANAALKIDPKDESASLILARELIALHRYDQAQKVLDALAADHPKDFAVSQLAGIVAEAQGRHDDAAKAFAEAVAINDNRIDRTRLAEAQAAGGHTEEAEKTVQTWLDTHPQDLDARRLLGDLYLANNKLDAATKEYLTLLQSKPKDGEVLNNLAAALAALKRPKEALAYARDAVAAAPNSVDSLDTLGTILLQNGVAAEAATDLNTAFQKSPNRPDVQFHLAQALASSGKNSDALDVLRGLLVRSRSFKERGDAEKLLKQLGG